MRYKLLFTTCFFFLLLNGTQAQQQPDKTVIRIVDTLSRQERVSRNPVIMKTELDSMIQLYNAAQPPVQKLEPAKEFVAEIPVWVIVTGVAALLIIGVLIFLLFGYHRRLSKTVGDLRRLMDNFEFYAAGITSDNNQRNDVALDDRINQLSEELNKEKEQHRIIMNEYGLVKQTIAEVYKVRNYPSFEKSNSEERIIKDLLKTEKAVANHAYELFLKPIITITDANKNNPAKMSKEDGEKLLDLLISLSLYHIEYLYLRINELSVGGNIAQRIGSNGSGIDRALLKKLSKEHGSRALALRLALNKAGITKLSYPVFDETDLNNF